MQSRFDVRFAEIKWSRWLTASGPAPVAGLTCSELERERGCDHRSYLAQARIDYRVGRSVTLRG